MNYEYPELDDLLEPVPETPATSGFVELDQAFTASDYGIEFEDTSFAKRDSQGRRWLGKKWSAPGQ
jgi:hypothetical protein